MRLGSLLILLLLTGTTVAQQLGPEQDLEQRRLTRGWHYPWLGPQAEKASLGFLYQKDFQGTVTYFDKNLLAISTDTFGDLKFFGYSRGRAKFTPSVAGVRVGSRVRVRCDNADSVRWVKVLPYHVWLSMQKD